MAVATLGERGSLALTREREIAAPSFAIAPRDTTGAGDVFHAAFAWGLLEGLEGEALLRAANGAAALSCRGLGAQGGVPTRAELDAFLRERDASPWRDPDAR
jgi:sugar/nucleoside kinase (ribokinase family)